MSAITKEEASPPPEDDFIAACNIAQRLSVLRLPDSTKLHKDKIKDLLSVV